jgi:dihydroorotase
MGQPPLREKGCRCTDQSVERWDLHYVLCSGHAPHEDESKSLEFDLADAGMISLQTFASNLVTLSKSVDWDVLLEKVTVNPRKLLRLEIPKIEVEAKANLTLFDPHHFWTFDEKSNFSKSEFPWQQSLESNGCLIMVAKKSKINFQNQINPVV